MTAMNETLTPLWAITEARLMAAVDRLVSAADPSKVLLFGSHARGDTDSHSDVDATDSPSESIGRIVEEGISNAIRHGKATRIDIVVSTRPDGTCDVAITDNGTGPLGGKPGVGSALLHQSSAGAWSLIALDRGSRLVVAVRS